MALTVNKDLNTGIELQGMYFRIDKINFNDQDFQVVATGYANKEAFQNNSMPVSEPRAYTLANYDRELLAQSNVFTFAYNVLKQHPVFTDAQDVFEDGQEPTT